MKSLEINFAQIEKAEARIPLLEADLARVREFEERLSARGGTPSESELVEVGRNQLLRVALPKEIKRTRGEIEGLSAVAFGEAGRLRKAAIAWLSSEREAIQARISTALIKEGVPVKAASKAVDRLLVPRIELICKAIGGLQALYWDQKQEPRAYANQVLAALKGVEARIGQPLPIK